MAPHDANVACDRGSLFAGARCRHLSVVLLGWLCLAGMAPAAVPKLSHVFPAGGQRGTKVTVTCTGTFTWPVQVFAPGVEVAVGSESGTLEITIPQDLPADRVWLRLYNAEGASAPFPFLIGSLPEVIEQEPNNTRATAQKVAASGVTINGVLQNADVDGFALDLTAGQTLVAALDANTMLGSPMDAILQVASPDGTVLADNHDDLGLDPRLAYTVPRDGTYIVRVFAFPSTPDTTIAFRGGANYLYRLTLTTGPYITHPVPLAAPREQPGSVEIAGWNIPAGTRLPVVPWGGAALAEHGEGCLAGALAQSPANVLGFAFSPLFAGGARVLLTPHAVLPSTAVTTAENPLVLTPPVAVTGWLREPAQQDFFQLPLNKGQQVVIAAVSRELEFPLDLCLRLFDPKGAKVAEMDDAGNSRDVVLTHTAAQDGNYRLILRDQYRQAGPRCCYYLVVRPAEVDFELSMDADAVTVKPDKPAELTIKIHRRAGPGAALGPITIQAVGLPPGVAAPEVVSEPSGPTAAEVKLVFSTSGGAFSGPIRIVGKASQPRELVRVARMPRLGAALPTVWLTAAP